MMVGDGGKKGKGDDENSEQIDGELVPSSEKPREIHDELEKIADTKEDLGLYKEVKHSMNYVDPHEGVTPLSAALFDLVTDEETVAAYVYKMDMPCVRPDEVMVEIWWGRALWVIGLGDEPVKVKLPSLNKMRVSEATASMNADSVLTITIPKRDQPWKWYEYKDLVFAWLKTVHVAVSG